MKGLYYNFTEKLESQQMALLYIGTHDKLYYCCCFFNSESCGRSHVIPVLTLPACAAGLALCQQRRALGVNHLHASVWQKAHSVSFHSNKPVEFLISICGKFVASFGTLGEICRQCSDNCTESETGKKNEGTKRLTFIFVKGLPA